MMQSARRYLALLRLGASFFTAPLISASLLFASLFLAPIAVAQNGSLSGVVVAAQSSKPIASAELVFPDLKRSVRADSAGRFEVADIPNGTHEVTVRHIGFEPFIAKLTFRGAEKVEADFLLNTLTTLERVDVTADVKARYASRLAEFEGRRKMGFGKFITQQQFEKNDMLQMSAILARSAGDLRVTTISGYNVAASSRGSQLCPVQVILNGFTAYNGEAVYFDISTLLPSSIIGVEYFTPLYTPMEFMKRPRGNTGGASCGTMIIWTK